LYPDYFPRSNEESHQLGVDDATQVLDSR
jgi:hypothetical protein